MSIKKKNPFNEQTSRSVSAGFLKMVHFCHGKKQQRSLTDSLRVNIKKQFVFQTFQHFPLIALY